MKPKKNTCVTYFLLASLLMPTQTTAQGAPGPQAKGVVGAIDGLIKQVGNTVLQGKRQQRMQEAQMRRMKMLQDKYGPSRGGPEFSKYFPQQCIVGTGNPNIPTDACSEGSNHPSRLAEAANFSKVASQNIAFLENLLKLDQEGQRNIGLQCLEYASKVELGKITATINKLKLEADNIQKTVERFKEQNSALLNDMKKLHGELNGFRTEHDVTLAGRLRDFRKEFSPACQDVLGNKAFENGIYTGFIGLKSENSTRYEIAGRTQNNYPQWQKNLQDKMAKIRSEIKKYGPRALNTENILGKDKYGMNKAIMNALKVEGTKFSKDYTLAQEALSKLGPSYKLPEPDQNFEKNISNLARNAKATYNKQYIRDCATGARYNVALKPEAILRGLKQKGTRKGTNVINYRRKLKEILAKKDAHIEDTVAQIAALDKYYGGKITITYRGGGKTGWIKKRPSELYQNIVEQCRTYVEKKNISGGTSDSDSQKIAKAEQYIKDMKKSASLLTTNISDTIYNQVANCGGDNLPAGSCNEQTMSPSSNNFCIKHAVTCAKSVRKCQSEIDAKIEERSQKLKNHAVQWNKGVMALFAEQEKYLQSNLLPAISQTLNRIKKYMPGAPWKYEKGSFISPPKLKYKYGVLMRGGGNEKDLKKLSQVIRSKIVPMLANQQEKLGEEYNKYIENKKSSITATLDKWQIIKENCKSLGNSIQSDLAQARAEQQRAQQEALNQKKGELMDYCQKYDLMRSNPSVACDSDSLSNLYEDTQKVMGIINKEALVAVGEFSALCRRSQNEASEDSDSDNQSTLQRMCSKNNNNWDKVKAKLKEQFGSGQEESENEEGNQEDQRIALLDNLTATIDETCTPNVADTADTNLDANSSTSDKASNTSDSTKTYSYDDPPRIWVLPRVNDTDNNEKKETERSPVKTYSYDDPPRIWVLPRVNDTDNQEKKEAGRSPAQSDDTETEISTEQQSGTLSKKVCGVIERQKPKIFKSIENGYDGSNLCYIHEMKAAIRAAQSLEDEQKGFTNLFNEYLAERQMENVERIVEQVSEGAYQSGFGELKERLNDIPCVANQRDKERGAKEDIFSDLAAEIDEAGAALEDSGAILQGADR